MQGNTRGREERVSDRRRDKGRQAGAVKEARGGRRSSNVEGRYSERPRESTQRRRFPSMRHRDLIIAASRGPVRLGRQEEAKGKQGRHEMAGQNQGKKGKTREENGPPRRNPEVRWNRKVGEYIREDGRGWKG